jgi:N-acetylglutamate synthase-like GNAT family acetyltransferase
VSSFQPNLLPDGYSIRLATDQDYERILDFSYSQPNNLLGLFATLVLIIWWQVSISENKIKTICIIFAGSILILILLNLYVTAIRRKLEDKPRITHVVEYDNIICGMVTYLVFDNFVYIAGMLVANNHRRKGIGSFMIQHCISTIRNPIYLSCLFEIKKFYERLGFVNVIRSQIPSELSRFKSTHLHLMVFNQDRY